jgi:hypothetical protein
VSVRPGLLRGRLGRRSRRWRRTGGASQRNRTSPGTRLAAGGLRFAVADQVADITDRYVVLNLPVEDTERLGRPQAPAVYHADPSEHAGGSLHD